MLSNSFFHSELNSQISNYMIIVSIKKVISISQPILIKKKAYYIVTLIMYYHLKTKTGLLSFVLPNKHLSLFILLTTTIT